MNALAFAWRSLVRQPARSALGVLGVAAVGALLFDMLLLSQGLVVSMRDVLDQAGFDVRITATDALPGTGPSMRGAVEAANQVLTLPSVRSAIALRMAEARIGRPDASTTLLAGFQGAGGGPGRPWTVLRGRDVNGPRELVVNETAAAQAGVAPGDTLIVRASCSDEPDALPPIPFTVAAVATFPFDTQAGLTIGADMKALAEACGDESGTADLVLVGSADGVDPEVAASAINRLRPDLRAVTNEEVLGRLQRGSFTYFEQISSVLTVVTLSFAVLLIAALLTVSVNQRLGEIAAVRALGFSRGRALADIFLESVLIVGTGGLISLPLGAALAVGLDGILKRMPGVPEAVHFFVFQPEALVVHGALLAGTAIAAALYPMHVVFHLEIATTLRNEVAS